MSSCSTRPYLPFPPHSSWDLDLPLDRLSLDMFLLIYMLIVSGRVVSLGFGTRCDAMFGVWV